MQTMKLARIPDQGIFWRRDNRSRFIRDGDTFTVFGHRQGPPVDFMVRDHEAEIVLLHPTCCGACFEELAWPPPEVCPFCNTRDASRKALATMCKRIEDWTGLPNAHI